MIKLKELVSEKDDCGCGCGGCETKVNESVDLPPGVELGRIFTGNGFAFKKEEFEEGTCGYGVDGELGDEPAGPHLIKKKKVGATVYIRKDGFFLRAYLPSKTNPDWKKLTQQWIPIGLKAHNKNLKKATDLAKELGAEKASNLFTWDKWLEKDEYQPPTKKKRSFSQ